MDECPCRYCTADTGRSDVCHSTCPKYLGWKKRNAARKQKQRLERAADYHSPHEGNWARKDHHWYNHKLSRGRKK